MPIVVYGAEGSWVIPDQPVKAEEKPRPVVKASGRRKRAHDPDGQFKADNPATATVDEAWEAES